MSVLCMRDPRSWRLGLFGLLFVALLLVAPGRAFAHASLSSSSPANGASVAAPETITLTFSKSFSVVDPGIQLLGADGKPVAAGLAVKDKTATLTPKAPLAPGSYGVKWAVKAPDSHPRTGAFTFTVTGTAAAAGEGGVLARPAGEVSTAGATPTVEGTQLAAALDAPSTVAYDLVGDLGRFILYFGVMIAIGALALGFFVTRASVREARWTMRMVRQGALLIAIGTLLTVFTQVALLAGPGIPWPWKFSAWTEAFASMWGLSVVCLLGASVALVRVPAPRFATTDTWMQTPALVGGPDLPPEPPADPFVVGRLDWRTGYPMFAALGVLLLGLAWNGHSQSSSPLLIAWLADIAHVLAVGVWGGGLILMLPLIARRRRAKNPALTVDAVLRFSVLATVASIGAGVTGLILAAVQLPSLGALFTSSFGQLLLAKVVVVAAIAAAGAYNHFRVLPALQADPGPAQAAATWKLLRLEAIGFVVVLGITAFLANASYS